MHFVVDKNIEAGASAGAGKMFQIACLSIEDPDRNSVDVTKLIDRGRHFLSDEELIEYICRIARELRPLAASARFQCIRGAIDHAPGGGTMKQRVTRL